jgi:hypothetical protein
MEPLTHDAAGLLPSQAEHSACGSPEKTLWFAVLAQALEDASGAPHGMNGGNASARQARADRIIMAARAWVSSNANRLGTFRWTCEIFELDADLVRARLRAGLPIHFDRDAVCGTLQAQPPERGAALLEGGSSFVTCLCASGVDNIQRLIQVCGKGQR